ncbi:MAG: NUDIX domain-containing protein [Anaerolineales bacterium]|nr:NUDIX domain-containing protein [Anaerolineales bacterium]
MPQSDQGVTRQRYMLIPRTAIFLRRGDLFLLIKGAPTKRLWAGKYNGLGGHVERGEDVCSAAKRELMEESGLSADLWLCGTVIVDAGEIGICLYVFSGESFEGEITPSKEGAVEWVAFDRVVEELPVVEDLPVILPRIQTMRRGDPPFSARSFYDDDGKLNVAFADSVPFGE